MVLKISFPLTKMAPTTFQIVVATVNRWWEGWLILKLLPQNLLSRCSQLKGLGLWGHSGQQGRGKPVNEQ